MAGTNKKTKLCILRAYIFQVAKYGCKTWIRNKSLEKKTTFLCELLPKGTWIERKLNKQILTELGVIENWLLNTITVRMMKYFGDIKRHNDVGG